MRIDGITQFFHNDRGEIIRGDTSCSARGTRYEQTTRVKQPTRTSPCEHIKSKNIGEENEKISVLIIMYEIRRKMQDQ